MDLPMPKESDELAKLFSQGWVSLLKFSKLVGVSYPTAVRMIKRGDVIGVRVGGVTRIYMDEVRRFMKGQGGKKVDSGEDGISSHPLTGKTYDTIIIDEIPEEENEDGTD